MTAQVDVDWGGKNVTMRISEGSTEVDLAIEPDMARRMIHLLEWAIGEVESFAEHMEFDGGAGRYVGRGKP